MTTVPLRVLHIVTRLGVGGLETEILNLVDGLERAGFEQAVCCLEDRGELAEQIPESIPVRSCSGGSSRLGTAWRAARLIRAWRPDLLHVRNGWAWPDAALAWLLAGGRGRLVFSHHGWHSTDRLPRRRAFRYRQLARITSGLASISVETARQFASETGIAPDRFTVLDSGVDVERFHPSAGRQGSGPLILGSISRLDPIKAHDTLIEAFAAAVDGGARNLELRFLGDGPTRADLERLARERNVADRVRFLGMRRDIPEQLRELDLFVLSSHREGRPISIMEALAAGLPVIATRVGSVPGMVIDGQTGVLVEPGDVEGMRQAIVALSDNAETRRCLAEGARRFAVSELSVDRMVEQYAAYYRDIARNTKLDWCTFWDRLGGSSMRS